MSIYSYHNFMFPFQWRIRDYDDRVFSEQISLNNITYVTGSNWVRNPGPADDSEADSLYNERNYFYEFVHDALYDNGSDNSLIRHFERSETKHGKVKYVVNCGKKVFELRVGAINLNLYSTGVGVLSFYLYNESFPEPSDVLEINQAGRRVFPPFIGSVKYRGIIAHSIEIKGLNGLETGYKEDFNRYTNKTPANYLASFIVDMIHEVAENIDLKPVIDDRMFVQCWYKNDEWVQKFSGDKYEEFLEDKHWYEFIFIDDFNDTTCQNDIMRKRLIKIATYERWQRSGSLYGISRYSMVFLTNNGCPPFLLGNFETMYARMAELILVQKASVLRFSAEVTNLSNMEVKRTFSGKVSSLYKEYIRFVNQIHFREISAQDQGIEMYQILYEAMNLEKHVEKLDAEIGELYNYVVLKEDHKSNSTMSLLTWIATISVPMTVMAGIFGMNNRIFGSADCWYNHGSVQLSIIFVTTIFVFISIFLVKNRRLK